MQRRFYKSGHGNAVGDDFLPTKTCQSCPPPHQSVTAPPPPAAAIYSTSEVPWRQPAASRCITTCAACPSDTPPSCFSPSVRTTPASTACQSQSSTSLSLSNHSLSLSLSLITLSLSLSLISRAH